MGQFTWTATNKRTKQKGGRITTHPDIEDIEEIRAFLELHYPYVEVSDLKIVDPAAVQEAGGAGVVGAVPQTLNPVPPEDFMHGITEAQAAQLAANRKAAEERRAAAVPAK